jgi:uncharacterized protein (TIGR03437 family)
VIFGVSAVALNADGTLNDCGNPAIAGSVVTLFLDGLGPVTPALATGAIAAAPAVALTPGMVGVDSNGGTIGSTTVAVAGWFVRWAVRCCAFLWMIRPRVSD